MSRLFLSVIYSLAFVGFGFGQNLILNSSFSEVGAKKDSSSPYMILPGQSSNVKSWYLPAYIYTDLDAEAIKDIQHHTLYVSSRDKEIAIKDSYFSSSDQLFENNLGYIRILINSNYPYAALQQKLSKPLDKGRYCLKFKYKFEKFSSGKKVKLEFALSSSDLKKFHYNKLKVPKNLIKVELSDTITDSDFNTPWQQRCYIIDLNGGEKFLTIGSLSNSIKWEFRGRFFIDDVELFPVSNEDACSCEIVNKDLRTLYKTNFPLNEEISNDTLVMFIPDGVAPGIISSPAKYYLNTIISFMQRNPEVKVTFIEYHRFSDLNATATNHSAYKRYLTFFGIEKKRINAKTGLCLDSTGLYCGHTAKYVKIGFILQRN